MLAHFPTVRRRPCCDAGGKAKDAKRAEAKAKKEVRVGSIGQLDLQKVHATQLDLASATTVQAKAGGGVASFGKK